ncbi:ATP-binding cassette sub-family C member 3-like [Babylonia areolata]|uniref:ATP-binding cassette sub-family C member 3-like n=1 Tax=Babylonia areolata TaxID=304850 RepID=UPI003FD5E7DC
MARALGDESRGVDWEVLPDQFCDSPFWDGNLTWNSSWPRVTDCFQKVALTGGPCALFWMTSLIYGCFLMTSKDDVLPAGKLSGVKTTCCTVLGLVSLCELTSPHLLLEPSSGMVMMLMDSVIHFRLTARALAPLAMLLTAAVSGVLTRLEQQKGLRSSAVLFLLWLLMSLCQTVPLCTILTDQVYVSQPVSSVLFLGKFTLILCLLVLHSLAEPPPPPPPPSPTVRKPCPEPMVPLWSRLTFNWMQELLSKAKDRDVGLTEKDIYELLDNDRSENVMKRFSPTWERELEKAKRRNQKDTLEKAAAAAEDSPEKLLDRLLSEGKHNRNRRVKLQRTRSMETPTTSTSFYSEGPAYNNKRPFFSRCMSEMHHQHSTEFDSLLTTTDSEVQTAGQQEKKKKGSGAKGEKEGECDSSGVGGERAGSRARPNFLLAMIRCFWVDFLTMYSISFFRVLSEMSDPALFGLLLAFLQSPSYPAWSGYMICAAMALNNGAKVFMRVRGNFYNHIIAIRIRGAIANSIFQKALRMDTESRQESTVGQAVNLMSVDTGDICHALIWMAQEVIFVPVKVVIALVILYNVLGSSMLLSVAMLAVMVPINSIVARKVASFHKTLMDLKDDRLKILTEVINGVKILKMYAWEPSFLDKVNGAREKELDVLWWQSIWDTCMHFYWAVTPYMVRRFTSSAG